MSFSNVNVSFEVFHFKGGSDAYSTLKLKWFPFIYGNFVWQRLTANLNIEINYDRLVFITKKLPLPFISQMSMKSLGERG